MPYDTEVSEAGYKCWMGGGDWDMFLAETIHPPPKKQDNVFDNLKTNTGQTAVTFSFQNKTIVHFSDYIQTDSPY